MMLSNPMRFFARIPRPLFSVGAIACAVVVGACDGANNVPGTTELATQAFFVHALNKGTFAGSTALSFPAHAVTRVDGTYNFDVAFDIDTNGNVMLLPPEMVGQNPQGNRLVGIIKGIGTFDNITAAPLTGYTVDSVTVIARGQAVAVQAQEPVCLTGDPGAPYLYAKIVIDSVDVVGRGIYGRAMIGGDCGYRQLIAGFPAF
jgi:hypothetical protein